MKKILGSIITLGVVGAVAVSAANALFSDSEKSTGNTFKAGALDLKIDSVAHYGGLICDATQVPTNPDYDGIWIDDNDLNTNLTRPDLVGLDCYGTWSENDLTTQKFFQLADLKPGDFGENTISLHVYNNDAWMRYRMDNNVDYENGCTEPESSDANDPSCDDNIPNQGELSSQLDWMVWLDQGSTPGFQCGNLDLPSNGARCDTDPLEGDNLWDGSTTEPLVFGGDEIDDEIDGLYPFIPGVQYFFNEALATMYGYYLCQDIDGNTGYESCHGFAHDGRIVGSTTYYFGTKWCYGTFNDQTGECDGSTATNLTQTDSFVGDNIYEIVQHRNNTPVPTGFTSSP